MTARRSRVLLIDESDDAVHGGVTYVVACAVVLTDGVQELSDGLRVVLAANPARTRPFHWSTEGPMLRTAVLSLVANQGAAAYAVVGEVGAIGGQEHVRYDCLRSLFRLVGEGATGLVVESREKALRNVGQNRTDHRAIVDARHAGDLPPTLRYRWADKTEPLVWAPDAIAGMALAAQRNDDTWIDLFRAAGGQAQIITIGP